MISGCSARSGASAAGAASGAGVGGGGGVLSSGFSRGDPLRESERLQGISFPLSDH